MLPETSFDIVSYQDSTAGSSFLEKLLSSAPNSSFSFTIDEILLNRPGFGRGKDKRPWPVDVFSLLGAVNAKSAPSRVSHVVAYALDIPQDYACTGCTQAKVNCYRADITESGYVIVIKDQG